MSAKPKTKALLRAALPLLLAFCFSCAAGPSAGPSHKAPEEKSLVKALGLLALAEGEGCPACAEQDRRKAVLSLASVFPPGKELAADAEHPLVRGEGGQELESSLPFYKNSGWSVILRWADEQKPLAGLAPRDYTQQDAASLLMAAAPGERFTGSLQTVPFGYGDGPSFLIQYGRRAVLVFVRVQSIAPLSE